MGPGNWTERTFSSVAPIISDCRAQLKPFLQFVK